MNNQYPIIKRILYDGVPVHMLRHPDMVAAASMMERNYGITLHHLDVHMNMLPMQSLLISIINGVLKIHSSFIVDRSNIMLHSDSNRISTTKII